MPLPSVLATTAYGATYGLLSIGWIVLNAVFLYNLTVATGQFEIVKSSVGRLSLDRRVQALLVAFSFGAFIEGAPGLAHPWQSARRSSSDSGLLRYTPRVYRGSQTLPRSRSVPSGLRF